MKQMALARPWRHTRITIAQARCAPNIEHERTMTYTESVVLEGAYDSVPLRGVNCGRRLLRHAEM
jgi:hypothetical protein